MQLMHPHIDWFTIWHTYVWNFTFILHIYSTSSDAADQPVVLHWFNYKIGLHASNMRIFRAILGKTSTCIMGNRTFYVTCSHSLKQLHVMYGTDKMSFLEGEYFFKERKSAPGTCLICIYFIFFQFGGDASKWKLELEKGKCWITLI